MSDEMALALANFLWASSETYCGSVVLLAVVLWENTRTLRSEHGLLGLRSSTRMPHLTSLYPGRRQPFERRTDLTTLPPEAYGKRQDTLMKHTNTHERRQSFSSEASPAGEASVLVLLLVHSSAGGAQSRRILLDDPHVLRHRVRQAAGNTGRNSCLAPPTLTSHWPEHSQPYPTYSGLLIPEVSFPLISLIGI